MAYEGEIWRNIRGHPVRINPKGKPIMDIGKSKLAKEFHVGMTKKKLDLSKRVQDFIADIIGKKAEVTDQWYNPELKRWVTHPLDILTPKWALEVKGRQTAIAHPRMNMEKEKRLRKYAWAKNYGYKSSKRQASIAVDCTKRPWKIYFKLGYAAYWHHKMQVVTPAELRKIIYE